ncbi:MAG: L-aspartate oxidase [Deltaproteobacteria bacterium]|nr:L-aspartate oxidase [Deltaproteobacteria bacterium]
MNKQADVLVLGSGVAGLTAALEAADRAQVLVLTKASPAETNTAMAQGGIAAVFGADDSPESHVQDTLSAGGGLCDKAFVAGCVAEGPERIRWLSGLGVEFEQSAPGRFDLGREGAHSHRRVVHVKDSTGRAVEGALLDAVQRHPNIEVGEGLMGLDLITLRHLDGGGREDRCIGCYVMDRATGLITTVGASATILATGGSGKVYLYTSNPDIATGDGLAMGWRAGAAVANMEFFQFHPTCLFHPLAKNFLISEAVRGEGGILLTSAGTRFMPGHHPSAELAPRDVVARAIDEELKKSGDDCVYLDISHRSSSFIERRFPAILGFCRRLGLDIRKEPIPVVPAAHYQCGGIVTDHDGWTGLPGLYAAGEVACTGMHGANRLASNSLLEALVMGRRAGATALKWLRDVPPGPSELPAWNVGYARHPDESVVVSQNWDEIRRFMWNYVGVVRSDNRLERARKRLAMVREEVVTDYWRFILTPDLVELRNLSDCAWLILEAALMRKESRGLHYNLDHLDTDDENWRHPIVLRRPGKGPVK